MKLALSLLAVTSLFVLEGCSIIKASTAPPPLALHNVKVGSQRIAVTSLLGRPKFTETKSGKTTEIYEFVDGSHSASKLRILGYIAGDIFTAGLSELIFWPLEESFGQGTKGRATVTYGMDDIAKAVLLTRADGAPWSSNGTESTSTGKRY